MIHYWSELAGWMALLFLLGCPLGAAARGLLAPPTSESSEDAADGPSGVASGPQDADRQDP